MKRSKKDQTVTGTWNVLTSAAISAIKAGNTGGGDDPIESSENGGSRSGDKSAPPPAL